MRADVKLGVVISAAVVTIAGGYFLFRGEEEKPIAMNPAPVASSSPNASAAHSKPTESTPADAKRPTTPGNNRVTSANNPGTSAPAGSRRERSGSSANPAGSATNSGANPPRSTAGNPAASAMFVGPPFSSQDEPGTIGANRPSGSSVVTSNAPTSTGTDSAVPSTTGSSTGSMMANASPGPSSHVPSRPAPSSPSVVPSSDSRVPAASDAGVAGRTAGSRLPSGQSSPMAGTPASSPAASNPNVASPLSGASKLVGEPSRTLSPSASRSNAGAAETHRVQAGETFSSIAQVYYGSEKHAQFLMDQNPEVRDPTRLGIGTRLKIVPLPADGGASRIEDKSASTDRTSAASSPAAPAAATGQRTYKVRAGDTLYGIAKDQLGSANRWRELAALNKQTMGSDPTQLQVGQMILLPQS